MNKLIIYICFYWPLINSCLNIQNFIAKFISQNIAQLIAYSNVLLIILGIFLIKRNAGVLSRMNRLWLIFYIIYYCFGLLAAGVSGFKSPILATLIPVIYFIGFNFLLSDRTQCRMFFKVLTISFVLSALLTLILFRLNFTFNVGGIYEYDLDRASGVYGDANNAALASIIAYVLFDKFYNPSKLLFKGFKAMMLLLIFYSLFVTFSTTGLFVFTIVFFLTNYKFFTGLRLALFGVSIVLLYVGIFSLKSQTKDLDLTKTQIAKVDNIINVLTFNLQDVDNSGRDSLFEHILYYLYKNPILGNGVDFSAAKRGHNTYIGVWVDAGILAFVFFLGILFYYYLKSFSLDKPIRFFSLSILIVLSIFMISLQTVLNQPYLIVLFPFIGYIIDYNDSGQNDFNFF
ncbi:O-antigen ligase family protein [Gelidibacter japonicus]|uniref:O-antigen ligase family protein n=1 Tax=Gelidibacter japonicus TaxID=1962232 RepID=UPI0013D0AE25|nr:hypothetical protein [Gelidibacter japonicus]MCL8005996.1 hypothetical protein [Gelidibacter japonicus]